MLERGQAVAITARELNVKHFKHSIWLQACRVAELNGQSKERVYAKMRFLQLVSGNDMPADSFIEYKEVIKGLNHRAEQFLWEGSVLCSMIFMGFMGSIYIL